jgi:hypothetical protein
MSGPGMAGQGPPQGSNGQGPPAPPLGNQANGARVEGERQKYLKEALSKVTPAQRMELESMLPKTGPEVEQPPPLGGEVPGWGYLYANAPTERQEALVETNPEVVRDALLRGIEVGAQNALLPFSEQKPSEWGHMVLMFAQAYLLLDPSVDNEGVPVEEKINAEAAGKASVQAHASGQAFERPEVLASGYKEPPRVMPNPAEKKIEQKGKSKTEELKGARGDLPRPKPRVGS